MRVSDSNVMQELKAGEKMEDDDVEGDQLQLVCDQKHPFFLRLLARDDMFSESFRYFALHGAAAKPAAGSRTGHPPAASVVGFVPFTWESSPGIPKQEYVLDHHDHDQGRPLAPPPSSIINYTRGYSSFNYNHWHHSSVSSIAPHVYPSSVKYPPAYNPTSSIAFSPRSASCILSAPAHYQCSTDGYLSAAEALATAGTPNLGLASRLKKLLSRRSMRRLHDHTSSLVSSSPCADSFASGSPIKLWQRTEHDQFDVHGDETYRSPSRSPINVHGDGTYLSPSRSSINDETCWPEDQSIQISHGVVNSTTDYIWSNRSRLDNGFFSFTDQSANSPINHPSAAADQKTGLIFSFTHDQSIDSPIFNEPSPAAQYQQSGFFSFTDQSATSNSPIRESSTVADRLMQAGGRNDHDEKDDINAIDDAAGGMNGRDEKANGDGALDIDHYVSTNGQMLSHYMLETKHPLSSSRIRATNLLVEEQQESLPPSKKTTSCLPKINVKRRHSTKREHST